MDLDHTHHMARFPSSFNGINLFRVIYTAFLSTGLCRGLLLTSGGPQTIRRAQGESVTLGCTYTWGPADSGDLDIEWSLVNPDATMKDQMLLSYSNGNKYTHGVADGVDFSAPDPTKGDASLTIAPLSTARSATYQCKVKKPPGVDMRKVTLVVMEKPSAPKCWIEGTGMVGEALSVHCLSSKGSAPLRYTWTRGRSSPLPPTLMQNGTTGHLVVRNNSQSLAGFYRCAVSNDVGEESCRVKLKANRPPNPTNVAIFLGSLLLLILLVLLVWLVVCKVSERRSGEKDFSNEIREDAPAPESRPGSRNTYRSSSQYRGVAYNLESRPESHLMDDMLENAPAISTSSPGSTPVNYDRNIVREDAPAPESRPGSRNTYRSSSQYRGVAYNLESRPESHLMDDMLESAPAISASSPGSTPVNYDRREDAPAPESRPGSRNTYRSSSQYRGVAYNLESRPESHLMDDMLENAPAISTSSPGSTPVNYDRNIVREDAPAPESRPGSRNTYRSSSQYRGVAYNLESRPESHLMDDMLENAPAISTSSPGSTPVNYDRNIVREDAPAPESRPGSRKTYRSSSQYRGVAYNLESRPESHLMDDMLENAPAISASSPGSTPVNYDRRYGYVV